MAAGALILIIGFLGCLGAAMESPCMLIAVSVELCYDESELTSRWLVLHHYIVCADPTNRGHSSRLENRWRRRSESIDIVAL